MTTSTINTPADTTPAAPPRLNAELFADEPAILAMVEHWTMDQLFAIGNMLLSEGDRRGAQELLEILRDLCAQPPENPDSPVVKIEFVTDSPYEDGVFWDGDMIYLHRADGSVEEFYWPEDPQDPEWDAMATRYADLLADYARADHPQEGDHLVVDLVSGEFRQTGQWSLC
ncbi:hypothetical protein ACODT5_02990 [Streptomyces sp. 5.8]|uniref:hypothetical protein n=1 Tax=Streptomyces sp. 5.8 TaxID=3406571 RepID=UPI003BB6E0C9